MVDLCLEVEGIPLPDVVLGEGVCLCHSGLSDCFQSSQRFFSWDEEHVLDAVFCGCHAEAIKLFIPRAWLMGLIHLVNQGEVPASPLGGRSVLILEGFFVDLLLMCCLVMSRPSTTNFLFGEKET